MAKARKSASKRLSAGWPTAASTARFTAPALPPLTRPLRATLPPPDTSTVLPARRLTCAACTVTVPPFCVATPPTALGSKAPMGEPSRLALFRHWPATDSSLPGCTTTDSAAAAAATSAGLRACSSSVPAGALMSPASSICWPRKTSVLPAPASSCTSAGKLMRVPELISTRPKRRACNVPSLGTDALGYSVPAASANAVSAANVVLAVKAAPSVSLLLCVKFTTPRLMGLAASSTPTRKVPPTGAAASWFWPVVAPPASWPSSTIGPRAPMASSPPLRPSA